MAPAWRCWPVPPASGSRCVASARGRRSWRRPAPPSVAILPLVDETGDPSLAWTAAGVAEMLAAHLAETPQLRVLEPARVLRTVRDLKLDGTADEPTLRRLADLLEVGHLVTGSVRRAGAAVRVDLRLSSARRRRCGWPRATMAAEAPAAEGLFRVGRGPRRGAARGAGEPARAERAHAGSADAVAGGGRGLPRGARAPARRRRGGRGARLRARAWPPDPSFAAALEALERGLPGARATTTRRWTAAERAAAALATDREPAGLARARAARPAARRAGRGGKRLRRAGPPLSRTTRRRCSTSPPRRPSQGAAAKAVRTLQRVTELDKADARAWLLLGRNMILAGDVRKAVTDPLVRALALMSQYGNEQGRGRRAQRDGRRPTSGWASTRRRSRATARRRRSGRRSATSAAPRSAGRTAPASTSPWASSRRRSATSRPRGTSTRASATARAWPTCGTTSAPLHEGRGAYAQARAAYREALRIRQELGDDQKLAQSYDNVGLRLLPGRRIRKRARRTGGRPSTCTAGRATRPASC